MKKIFLHLIVFGFLANSLSAQVYRYSETFSTLTTLGWESSGNNYYQYSVIPSNMVGINANGATALADLQTNWPFENASVATAAWACVATTSDTVGVCTSRLSPAGQADKWLISPPISGLTAVSYLKWEALPSGASPNNSGYEVWVSAAAGASSNPTVANFTGTASNKVFSIAAEAVGPWMKHYQSLAAFAGQTVRFAFRNNATAKYKIYLDDILVYDPLASDIELVSVSPAGLMNTWGAVNSTKTISGVITSKGSTPITSFTAKYGNGTPVSQTFSGLNITLGQTYTFTFTTPYTIPTASIDPVKVWVELANDPNHINDTLATSIKGYSFLPKHKVVFHEATGTGCGWCPRGTVFMDSIFRKQPDNTVLITVHDNNFGPDPMTVNAYASGVGQFISSDPNLLTSGQVNIGDPSYVFDQYSAHIGDFGLGDLTVTSTFNTTTRVATVVVGATIASTFTNNNAQNDFRLAVAFTEMGVTGTASGYGQHNYYSSTSQNQPLVGAGHNWQQEASIVPASKMKYDFVARTIAGGFLGQPNSLPNSIVAGTPYTYTFTYTVPAGYKEANMRAHALLIDARTWVIYNGNSVNSILTSVNEVASVEKMDISIYPNPASTTTDIQLNLTASQSVLVNVYNTLGELVYSDTKNNMPAGENKITLNTVKFSNGIYNIAVSSKEGVATQKLIINK